MKTVKISARLLAIALVASFTMAFASPASANDDKKLIPVEMKYAGNMKDQPLFHLVFTGTEEREFTICIRDENGNTLYREIVKGASFTRRFLLNTDELGDTELKFEISSKSYEKPVVFEINRESRLVESLVVNKVK
ncbi:MAG: hypothetical protein Q8941_16150 [Bacteroidota bacterium]|nr:hypothetical protein [Bacteroidota bacterium]